MATRTNPLTGPERDEIEALVLRIRRADEKVRKPVYQPTPMLSADDIAWADDQKLPREFFEFFELQRVA